MENVTIHCMDMTQTVLFIKIKYVFNVEITTFSIMLSYAVQKFE